MPYDDDEYWSGFAKIKPPEPPNPANAQRSPAATTLGITKSLLAPRAKKPSPLLEAWLKERGMTVK
jgi:hypothetical protein